VGRRHRALSAHIRGTHWHGPFRVPERRCAPSVSGSEDGTLRLWHLDWELEACEPADWDEGARPYLETFLNCHTPYLGTLAQDRAPTEEEIQQALHARWATLLDRRRLPEGLLHTLGCAGYGWVRPDVWRAELERMALKSFDGEAPTVHARTLATGESGRGRDGETKVWRGAGPFARGACVCPTATRSSTTRGVEQVISVLPAYGSPRCMAGQGYRGTHELRNFRLPKR
jgi:hypothetical protein